MFRSSFLDNIKNNPASRCAQNGKQDTVIVTVWREAKNGLPKNQQPESGTNFAARQFPGVG